MSEKFHKAARDGYLDLLKVGTRKDMNTADEDGNTPTLLASQHGNLDALRMVIMRGGDPNKMDLLGSTALHHAARNGHMNCVTFLVHFGANIWAFDNDMHNALDAAALENHEDIVYLLDEAQTTQQRKSPKIVQGLKEKAIRDAERNAKYYERLQDKAARELAKTRKRIDKNDQKQGNPDFKAPSDTSFFKKLSMRIKSDNALKTKQVNGTSHQFSDFAISGGTKKRTQRSVSGEFASDQDFRISEMDESGNRNLKSLRGAGVKGDAAEVMYVTNRITEDSGTRPALTNVFPNTSLDDKTWGTYKRDSTHGDSGIDSFDSTYNEEEDEPPSLFSRSGFGAGVSKISFLGRFDHFNSLPRPDAPDDGDMPNGSTSDANGDSNNSKRLSSGTDSLSTTGSPTDRTQDLPWKDDDVESLDDDEEETEYSNVLLFLESCGLSHYAQVFTSNDVDMESLIMLTNQDFQDMELPIGPRRKLMDAIQRRKLTLESPSNIHDTYL